MMPYSVSNFDDFNMDTQHYDLDLLNLHPYDLDLQNYDLDLQNYDLDLQHYDLDLQHYDLDLQHYDLDLLVMHGLGECVTIYRRGGVVQTVPDLKG